MAPEAVDVVNLEFKSHGVGGGSLYLQVAIDPIHKMINGQGDGRLLLGTRYSPCFTVTGHGDIYWKGFGKVTIEGCLSGQATVSCPPPEFGCYLSFFRASFVVDDEWKGTGLFTVGSQTYDCEVTEMMMSEEVG